MDAIFAAIVGLVFVFMSGVPKVEVDASMTIGHNKDKKKNPEAFMLYYNRIFKG